MAEVSKETLDRYSKMSPADKINEIKQVIYADMAPLNLLFAVMLIVEPNKVEEVFKRLTD